MFPSSLPLEEFKRESVDLIINQIVRDYIDRPDETNEHFAFDRKGMRDEILREFLDFRIKMRLESSDEEEAVEE
jgi:hypothetical protein